MKNLSIAYKNSVVNNTTTTLAYCIKIVRSDGSKLGFTTHTRDVVFSDESDLTYKATGFTPTAYSKSSQLNVDNLEQELIIDGTLIKEDDLEKGLYDNAKLYYFRFNYMLQPYIYADIEKIIDGTIGEVTRNKQRFNAELRSKTQLLQNSIVDVTKANCSANFCDSKCGLNIATYTYTDTVDSGVNSKSLILNTLTNDEDDFNNGLLTFTSGLNAGYSFEIKKWDSLNKQLYLQTDMQFEVSSGDNVTLIVGCNKTLERCKHFNNVINFRGFPYVVGNNYILRGGA